MKKALVLMTALIAISFSASAQKTKAEKDAERAQQEAQTAALIDRIVPAKNFQFIPYEYVMSNTGTTSINRYEYTYIRPGSLEAAMTNCPAVNTNRFEWVLAEKKKDIWNVKIQTSSNAGATLEFNFAINAKTGIATLRVRSNKALDANQLAGANTITYKGTVREY